MLSRLVALVLVLLAACPLRAQTSVRGDGRQPVEKPGIALVKPQKWSQPNEAVPVRFTAYTNRGGYFVLRLPSGQERQVWIDQMVGREPLVEPEIPREILEPAQRNALQDRLDAFKAFGAKVPAATADITRLAQPLAEAIQRYDAGEVRTDGSWEPVSRFRAREFSKAESQLRLALGEEKEKSKFPLAEHSLYKRLVELAKDDPHLEARLDAIRSDFQSQLHREQLDKTLARLSDPSTPDFDIPVLLAQLQAVKNPDQRVVLILQQADTARLLAAESAKLQAAMESHFAATPPSDAAPRLPADLAFQIEMMDGQIRKFHESRPPAAIRLPEGSAEALVTVWQDLPKVAPLLEQRNHLAAANLLDRIAAQAAKIGPSTQSVVVTLKTAATQKVDLFAKLRAEGDAEETAGNIPAAIAKYTAALEVSRDPELTRKIEQLRNPAKE